VFDLVSIFNNVVNVDDEIIKPLETLMDVG
jgi:hypothetical protein